MVDSRAPSEDVLVSDASTTVIGDDRPAAWRELELPRGSQVGRYVVLSRLGAGAMGLVVAAYDPELDRKVALKLLHPREDRRAHLGHRRLLAEAQALARLSDPNVVTVHDVGLHEGRVFVAMEFVAGQTLKAWLAAAPRPWPEVLDVMTRAGRGLVAAHARDLVHRDFKPENVMLGDDGRVRVMDFGLAREADTSSHDLDDDLVDVTGSRQRALGQALTQLGALVGTPAYMAPEQLAGGRGGPAADQFSFCTSLWEALYGQRPFVDETLAGLQARILMGQLDKPPAGVSVPRWLRRVVEQGLAVEPAQRWPSMQALVSALEHGRVRARRRRVLAILGLVALTGSGVVGGQRWDEHRRIRACEAEGASIEEVWNDDVAARVHEALTSSGLARAEVTARNVRPWIDAHARTWNEARTEACLATEVRATWDPPTAERARWCLEERRMELEALVTALASKDVRVVDLAVVAAVKLNSNEPCLDAQRLARRSTPPTEEREAVRAIQAELARIDVQIQMGAYEEAITAVRAASASASALGWPPLVAAAQLLEGRALQRAGSFAESEAVLERAYFEAVRAEALEVAVVAAARLTFVVGYDLARLDDGLRWAQHHEALMHWVSDPSGIYELQRLSALSAVYFAAGDFEQVLTLQQRIIPEQERLVGPNHLDLATSFNNLGNAYYRLGKHEDAQPNYERALAIDEATLGAEHPWVADKLGNLGLILQARGKHREALALDERALAIQEATLRPDHPAVATTLNNLAVVHQSLGDYDQAIALQVRALAIWEAALGPQHPDVALCIHNLGVSHGLAGRLDQARALYERALATFEMTVGPDHPDVAMPLRGLATIAIDQGRVDEAVPLAERALRLREGAGLGPDLLAPIRFVLAQALWEQGLDRTRALALARRALVEHRERGEAGAKDAAEAAAWLTEHSPSEATPRAQAPSGP